MKSRARHVVAEVGCPDRWVAGCSGRRRAARALAAEEEPFVQPFEIGIFGGLHFYDKQSGLGRYVGDPEGYSPDLGGAFGLRLAYNLNRWVGVEAEGMISPTHTRFSDAAAARA